MMVEGVSYEIDWSKFQRGASIFIPCLNPVKAKREVRETINRLRFSILMQVVIVEGIRGLRIWRM
jgi:hypothetical protein